MALIDQVLALSDLQRAELAERLLHSLDRPDARIDALWLEEARARVQAFDSGAMEEVPEGHFFSDEGRS